MTEEAETAKPPETAKTKFCPFSKAPCGGDICALWGWITDDDYECAFVAIADHLREIQRDGINTTNHY